eukprot:1653973-Pyramimonas_sp.AAC.1
MSGDICVRPSVGALIGDPWAVKALARDISTVIASVQGQFDRRGPESITWCQFSLHHDGEDIVLDVAFHSYVDDVTRKIVTEEQTGSELS